jgi:hypothetical protein
MRCPIFRSNVILSPAAILYEMGMRAQIFDHFLSGVLLVIIMIRNIRPYAMQAD